MNKGDAEGARGIVARASTWVEDAHDVAFVASLLMLRNRDSGAVASRG